MKKRIVAVLMLILITMLIGCGQKCEICEENKATKEYLGTPVCDDCYDWIVFYMAESQSESEEKEVQQNLVLKVEKMYHESGFVHVEGTVTNNSNKTVDFIEVKVSYKNSNGDVIDTTSTYACGGEGLAPGESTKFETMDLDRDNEYKKVTCKIYDFDIMY